MVWRTRIALASFVCVVVCIVSTSAQWDKKPYSDWSEKDSLKMLENSPWAQTHVVSDTSKAFNTDLGRRSQSSTASSVTSVNFRVRFLSARPVRQAICRLTMIQRKGEVPEQMKTQLKALAEGEFPDYVVVAVTCDSDRGSTMLQQANETLRRATTVDLKNNTYLIANDGQRVYLQEYQAPRNDGFGARFIFPRIVNGKPIINSEDGEIVFHSEFGGGSDLNSNVTSSDIQSGFGFTLHTRYKVKGMTFQGKLEY